MFVDTSGFFAAASDRDRNFPIAQRILGRLMVEGAHLVTTTYIVAEAHALFLSRAGRQAGVRFLNETDGSFMNIVRPTESDEARAREIIYRYTCLLYTSDAADE